MQLETDKYLTCTRYIFYAKRTNKNHLDKSEMNSQLLSTKTIATRDQYKNCQSLLFLNKLWRQLHKYVNFVIVNIYSNLTETHFSEI